LLSSHPRSFGVDPPKGRCLLLFSEHRRILDVATRPADQNGLGLSHEEVLKEVSSIEKLLTLLSDIPAIYAVWKDMVRDHRVQGVKVYDARLVATMKVYAVESVLTFNVADFGRYTNIIALHPSSLVA
jgi:predicted nucleic acid-binding protein